MRQRRLYHGLRQRISIEDLLHSATTQATSKDSTSHLLNLVMQFRKVRVGLRGGESGLGFQ